MDLSKLPFNQHLGLKRTEHHGQEAVVLDAKQLHTNHLGSIHAGVVFSLAESASGQALLKTFQGKAQPKLAVLRKADVKYRREATGRVLGLASIDDPQLEEIERRLRSVGRAMIDIRARVIDQQSTEVFVGTFTWYVSDQP